MTFLKKLLNLNITIQIAIGIIFAVILSLVSQEWSSMSGIFGQLFVQSLKAVAPVLVLFLVISALANQTNYKDSKIQPIVMLYIFGTFSAAFLAVLMSKLFPINL